MKFHVIVMYVNESKRLMEIKQNPYFVKKEKTMFYYHPNIKEQLAKLAAQVGTIWVRSRLYCD